MEQIFESKNIRFVKVSEHLIKDYLVMINDFENVQKLIRRTSVPHEPYTKEQETDWVKRKLEENACIFSMLEKKTGSFIGNIELMDLNDSEGELGIAITAKKQNLGYGTEAIFAMTEYGCGHLGLKRIFLKANPENKRAIHVYEKCGFREYNRTDEHVFMEIYR
ncbi:MAG: GNAT family N-acetyltransferase [Clostridia bacterium]|nr:GNAT family N-acetyltransferase [Clostridia bacterium]